MLGQLPQAAADLVRVGDAVRGADPTRAARLYAEAVLPLTLANQLRDLARVAAVSDALGGAAGQSLPAIVTAGTARALRGECGNGPGPAGPGRPAPVDG